MHLNAAIVIVQGNVRLLTVDVPGTVATHLLVISRLRNEAAGEENSVFQKGVSVQTCSSVSVHSSGEQSELNLINGRSGAQCTMD